MLACVHPAPLGRFLPHIVMGQVRLYNRSRLTYISILELVAENLYSSGLCKILDREGCSRAVILLLSSRTCNDALCCCYHFIENSILPFNVSQICLSNLELPILRPTKVPIAVPHQPASVEFVFVDLASTESAFHLIKRDLSPT